MIELKAVREYYDALICENGHVLSGMVDKNADPAAFCPACGARAIQKCSECDSEIRGWRVGAAYPAWPRPKFCHRCGHPFPWTAARSEALIQLANEAEGLDDGDRRILAESLPDLGNEGPRTELAATLALRVLKKATGGAAAALYQLVVDVSSETAIKILKQGAP